MMKWILLIDPLIKETLSFSDACSPVMEQLLKFHDYVMMVVMIILMFVLYIMSSVFWGSSGLSLQDLSSEILEIVWTILPIILIIMVAMPSLEILYFFEEEFSVPKLSLKVVGHQWYWSYEININSVSLMSFDSYYDFKGVRLESVDSRVILPFESLFRILVTSSDVIHSWAVPSLGVKLDAVPGRINQELVQGLVSGVYKGFCSEICGVNHSQMPIEIELVPMNNFLKWVKG